MPLPKSEKSRYEYETRQSGIGAMIMESGGKRTGGRKTRAPVESPKMLKDDRPRAWPTFEPEVDTLPSPKVFKRQPFSVRLLESTRDKLEKAAAKHGVPMSEEIERRLEKSLIEDFEYRSRETQAVVSMLRAAIFLAESRFAPVNDPQAPEEEKQFRPWFRHDEGVAAVREAVINEAEGLFGESDRWIGRSHQRAQRLRDLKAVLGRDDDSDTAVIDDLIEQAIKAAAKGEKS